MATLMVQSVDFMIRPTAGAYRALLPGEVELLDEYGKLERLALEDEWNAENPESAEMASDRRPAEAIAACGDAHRAEANAIAYRLMH